MRILFMGTPEFAVPCLDAMNKEHEVIGIYTKVDKVNKRGGKITYLPVKQYGLDHNIPIYQPTTLKDGTVEKEIREMNPDLIVVVAYGKIIPQSIIDIPKYGIINVHSSLLPKYRGAAPINAALINGDDKTGVTIMYIAEELDAGDIILTKETEITEEETFLTLHDKLKDIGAEALTEAVRMIFAGTNPRIPQNHSEATFVKPFKKEDLKIDWNKGEKEIYNFVRGINPFPCAFTTHNGKMLKVYEVKKNGKVYEKGENGEIVDKIKGKGPVVKVGDGSLILTLAKPESKKVLSGADLLNGNVIKIGEKLL